jgi:hypothetical protein
MILYDAVIKAIIIERIGSRDTHATWTIEGGGWGSALIQGMAFAVKY